MYEPKGFALEIFKTRYTIHEHETWAEACERVGQHAASAETGDNLLKYRTAYADALRNNLFMPGGRIWYGSGRPKGQCLNCVSGDTLIHTDIGLCRADSLVGKNVNVLSAGGVYRQAKWFCYGEQELFEVMFSNGDSLFATEGHEWVVTGRKHPTDRVLTSELVGRCVQMQPRKNFEYIEEEWKQGVQHGLTFGDGCLYGEKKNYSGLRLFGEKKEYAARFFDKWSDYTKIDAYQVNRLPPHFKTLPSIDSSDSYLRGFIAGLIGTDGCVDSRGHTMLHQANLKEATEIRKISTKVGLPVSSIKLARSINPWNGEPAPLYKLSFVKSGFWINGALDLKMVLKRSHIDKFNNSATPEKKHTVRVVAVRPTGRCEPVFCCVEPETHTMVIGPGFLTGQCFVVGSADSREGWAKTISNMLIISATGGGVGINGSPVRPRGMVIDGTGGKATGAVSLFRIINAVGEEVKAGGGRRTALMLSLNINHGDILEFLGVKLDLKQLNNANISVIFSENPEEFFAKVKDDSEIDLQFRGKTIAKVRARELWEKIILNALKNGEPGLLNGYYANRMSNVWYKKTLINTNPCGEQWLPDMGSCCLGALVLPKFLVETKYDGVPGMELDWDALKQVTALGVRFLDNILTVNNFPLQEIKEVSANERRVGLGVMGLATMLLRLGLRYNSPVALELVDKVMNFIKNAAYEASVELAKEKGAFPEYDTEQFLKGGFVKTLKPSLRDSIRRFGIRNCTLLTIAPTGTTSIVSDVDSGIEPAFGPGWTRRFRNGEGQNYQTEIVVHPLFREMHLSGKSVNHFQSAYDLKLRDHFEMQRVCQRHIDGAVSKTVALPQGTSPEELSELYMEFFPELKGVTVYPEGSRENQPITPFSVDKALQHLDALGEGPTSPDSCRDGSCET